MIINSTKLSFSLVAIGILLSNKLYATTVNSSQGASYSPYITKTFSGKKYAELTGNMTIDPNGNEWILSGNFEGVGSVTELPMGAPKTPIVYSGTQYQFNCANGIASDPQGNIWVADTCPSNNVEITELPAGNPTDPILFKESAFTLDGSITSDPDGNIWLTVFDYSTKIHTIAEIPVGNPSNPVIYQIPAAGPYVSFMQIESDAGGNIWALLNTKSDIIVKLPAGNPSDYSYHKTDPYNDPTNMTIDSAGNLWYFSNMYANQYDLVEWPKRDNKNPLVYQGDKYGFGYPDMTSDSQGNIWVANDGSGDAITEVPVNDPNNPITYANPFQADNSFSNLGAIVADQRGNIWITVPNAVMINNQPGTALIELEYSNRSLSQKTVS